MPEFLNNFFFTRQFIPQGDCYLWKTELVWLHVVSDSLIALAYYSIAIMLVYFVRKQRDVPFDWIFLMFGTFIVVCGTTHLMEVWTLWHPTYWLSGFIKLITAFVSLCTAVLLVPLIAKALALPSSAQLQAANVALKNEITERQRAESALVESQTRLSLINSISTAITSGMSVEQVIEHTLKQINEYFNTLRVAYSTFDEQGNLSVVHSIEPPGMSQIRGKVADLTAAPEYLNALHMCELVMVEDVATDRRLVPLADSMKASGNRAILEVPLQHSEKLVGVLCFDSPEPKKWSEHEIVTLREVADCLSVAIKEAYAQQDRQRVEEELLAMSVALQNAVEGISQLDTQGRYIAVNTAYASMVGSKPEEMIGMEWLPMVYPEDHEKMMAAYKYMLSNGKVEAEARGVRKDGSVFYKQMMMISAYDKQQKFIGHYCFTKDITERKHAEEEIKASLQEKEVLLKEVHHRVKNNLQIIDSLFRQQCRHTKDKQTIEILKECQNRVNSMALLHEKLYQSKDLAKIDFAGYMRSLVANLCDTYSIDTNIPTLKINVNDIFLDIETALPCGLIVNELVSNSLKYAFIPGKQGEITINFTFDNAHKFMLVVKDNGVGLPENFDWRNLQSLGLKLVRSLVRQLGGAIEINCSGGTEFLITFSGVKDDGSN